MTEHAAGVAEAEVDVLVAVHVMEARALGPVDEQRAGGRPVGHPVHRHAAEQRMASALAEGHGSRVLFDEALPLTGGEGADGGVGDSTGGHA
ncbi:hypothetical protein D3C72_2263420 [compost metagenome]